MWVLFMVSVSLVPACLEAENEFDSHAIRVVLGPRSTSVAPREAKADPPTFVLTISDRDAVQLGARQTVYPFEPEYGFVAYIPTRFVTDNANIDEEGPCLNDPIVATHVETGDEFVVTEAGHCIVHDWEYRVDGAYDYLDE